MKTGNRESKPRAQNLSVAGCGECGVDGCCQAWPRGTGVRGGGLDHPALRGYNAIMSDDLSSIGLALPWEAHFPPEKIRTLMDLVYQVLGLTPETMFPLECRPRVSVRGWPVSIKFDGFVRPLDHGGRIFEFVR